MASRSKIGATWTASDTSNANTLALPARTITAGSLVIVAMRYEGPGSGTVTGVSDGTRNYTVLTEYGANPTVCIAYYYNHPGETNSVITFSVSGTSTIYKEAYAVEYDGSDASNPFDTSATANGTNPSVNYTAAGAGQAFAVIGYYSGSSITPTSPATSEGSQTYSGFITRTHSAGSNSIGATGGAGNTNTLVAVFNDAGGGDTTAPVLTSPTGTATGSTTATVGATTDEGNGTLYAFVSTSATPPSDADLIAGTGATWAGSVAVSSTGAKTLNATGLTASTGYYAHLLHRDAASNDSNTVTSAQFTTSAPADPPVITDHPDDTTVKRGQTATFSCTATGSGTLTYQWQRNPGGVGSWADISGATSSSYTTPATTVSGGSANDQDDYRCRVSDDDAGPTATNAATLTVQQCVLALNTAGYEVLSGNAPDTAAGQSGETFEVAAYPVSQWPLTSPVATASGTLNSSHRLTNLGDDDLVFGTTYRVEGRLPDNANEPFSWLMTAS